MQLARSSRPVHKTQRTCVTMNHTETTDYKGVPSDFSALSAEFDSVGEALAKACPASGGRVAAAGQTSHALGRVSPGS
jgi:hypothetical protein